MKLSEIHIGVDWSQGDSETCVVFMRKDNDGTVTLVADLRGEAAEYVAQLKAEHATLKQENEELRWKAQAVVNGAGGGEFDKFSGFDDYVISYQLIDELADALLAAEEHGQ